MKILLKTLCVAGFFILMAIGVNAVVINEVNYDAESAPQFIELYNLTSSPIDLESWEIQAAGTSFSTVVTLPAGSTIPANGHFLVSAGAMSPTPDTTNAGLVLDNTVSTDIAGVRLSDDSANVIDTVLYGYSTGVTNSNNLQDDLGSVDPANAALGTLGTCSSISRSPEGTDTDVSIDDFFEITMSPTNSLGQTDNPCAAVPTTVSNYAFASDEDGWTTGGAPTVFTMPTLTYESGSLRLQSTENSNLYGFWESPRNEITFVADNIYRTTFSVRSDQTDITLVPQFRVQMRSQSETIGVLTTYYSFQNSDVMPNTTGGDYVLYVDPMNLEGFQEGTYSGPGNFEDLDDLLLAFDIVNVGGADAATASLYLDSVVVDRFDKSAVEGGTTVKVYDSTADFANWKRDGAYPIYELPTFTDGDGSITMSSTDTTGRYGFVESSTAAAEVAVEAGKLYRVLFTVSSTTAPLQARFRIYTETFKETYLITALNSFGGVNAPQSGGTTYQGFLYPPQSDSNVMVGCDFINFDAPTGADVTLSRVEIQTLDPLAP